MKIAIGSDHAGFEMKTAIVALVRDLGHEVIDYGTNSAESCDYPVFGERVGRAVLAGEAERGILICGTGVGIGIAANRLSGIRCVTCSEPLTAALSRQHNDSNVLAIGARILGPAAAENIVKVWLTTDFEGGRHQRRIDQLTAISAIDDCAE